MVSDNIRASVARKAVAEMAAVLLAACVLSITGCTNGSMMAPVNTPTVRAQFAYTADLKSATLSGYTVDPSTGVLTPLPGFPINSGLNPVSIIHDPPSHFAIVADIAADTVRVY